MMTVQAVDDIITAELQPGIPIVLDVLANDSGSTPLHLVSISMSTAGVTSIVAGNPMGTGPESRDRISYTPGANFFGSDLLTYTVADLSGSQSTASVSLIQAAGGGAGTPPGGAGTPPGGTGTPPGGAGAGGLGAVLLISSMHLVNDTEAPTDNVTSDPRVQGYLSRMDAGTVNGLKVQFDVNGDAIADGYVFSQTDGTGRFEIDPSNALSGNGPVTLAVRAGDSAAVFDTDFSGWQTFSFTWAPPTPAPSSTVAAVTDLHLVNDTGTAADQITTDGRLAGQLTNAGGAVAWRPVEYDVDADGAADGVIYANATGAFTVDARRISPETGAKSLAFRSYIVGSDGTDAELGVGEEALHGLRENVRGRVADDAAAVVGVRRDRLDLDVGVGHPGQVAQLSLGVPDDDDGVDVSSGGQSGVAHRLPGGRPGGNPDRGC